MKYLDCNARITGTIDGFRDSIIFENQREFDEYRDGLTGRVTTWEKPPRPIANQKLWDEQPDRFPCLMLTAAEMSNPDGADWIVNSFLYDVEIHSEEDEEE